MANRILTEFLTEMKEILKVKKTVVFPGLGRLRATRENHFFFVADEDLDIYPEGLGLVPLSLKTHVETPEEVATAVAGLAELIVEPEPEPEPVPEAVEEIPEQVGNDGPVPEPVVAPEPAAVPEPEPAPVPEPEAPKRDWVRILLIALGAVAALLVLCALLGRIAPGLMDHLLYSKEELEILRY